MLIVQGTADTTVPAVTSKETAALARAGTRVTCTAYEVDAWLDARWAR
ncbi:hypothetical protein ACFVWP_17590 [Streptomyces sp. NPDC058175]